MVGRTANRAIAEPRYDVTVDLRLVSGGIAHPECVAWYDNRAYCGTEAGALRSIDLRSGRHQLVAEPGGMLNGLAFDGNGACYVCDAEGKRVVRVTPDDDIRVLIDTIRDLQLRHPNFLAFDPDGLLWITDSGSSWDADDGVLFAIAPGGQIECVERRCPRFPNGLAIGPGGDRLYVVESRLPGVVSYTLAGGCLDVPEVVAKLPGTVPDGIAFDELGALYIGCWRPDRIYRIDPVGALEVLLDDPTGEYLNTATNICFGGREGRTLLIAGLGGREIRALELDVHGLELATPRWEVSDA